MRAIVCQVWVGRTMHAFVENTIKFILGKLIDVEAYSSLPPQIKFQGN